MAEHQKLYLYRHGSDTDAIGNDTVRLFSDKERAIRYMRDQIEEYYECSWDDFVDRYSSNCNNVVEHTYVEIAEYNWTNYYMVDSVKVDAA